MSLLFFEFKCICDEFEVNEPPFILGHHLIPPIKFHTKDTYADSYIAPSWTNKKYELHDYTVLDHQITLKHELGVMSDYIESKIIAYYQDDCILRRSISWF